MFRLEIRSEKLRNGKQTKTDEIYQELLHEARKIIHYMSLVVLQTLYQFIFANENANFTLKKLPLNRSFILFC